MDASVDMTSPTHIDRVVVINDDSVVSGGAAMIAIAGIRAMRARDIPVTFITGDSGQNPDLQQLGVDIVALSGQHILEGSRIGAAARGIYNPRMANAVEMWIASHDTPGTIYHLHNWHKVLSAAVMRPLRKVERRLLISTHDFFLACPNGGYFNFRTGTPCELTPMSMECLATACDKRNMAHKVWRSARHFARQKTFDFATTTAKILTVHEGMRPLLVRGGIPDASIVTLRNPTEAWRTERVPAEKNRKLLFVGRLERDKGIQVLLGAASRLGVEVGVVGSGPMMSTLRSNYPNVQFFGQCSREGIAELAKDARLVVIPSLARETFSLVALEALQSGIPVVISKFALIGQEIEARDYGRTCSPDVTDLCATISFLLERDDVVCEMSRKAFESARELTLDPVTWGDRLLGLYSDSSQVDKPLTSA